MFTSSFVLKCNGERLLLSTLADCSQVHRLVRFLVSNTDYWVAISQPGFLYKQMRLTRFSRANKHNGTLSSVQQSFVLPGFRMVKLQSLLVRDSFWAEQELLSHVVKGDQGDQQFTFIPLYIIRWLFSIHFTITSMFGAISSVLCLRVIKKHENNQRAILKLISDLGLCGRFSADYIIGFICYRLSSAHQLMISFAFTKQSCSQAYFYIQNRPWVRSVPYSDVQLTFALHQCIHRQMLLPPLERSGSFKCNITRHPVAIWGLKAIHKLRL